MNTISAIDHLECIVDGDTLVPGMGYVMDSNIGRTQFVNIMGDASVSTPSYREHPVVLYPQVYSSSRGTMLVPDSGSVQWYVNDPSSESNAILNGSGQVAKYSALFEVSQVTVNGKTFPALKLKGNLYDVLHYFGDMLIYMKARYNGIEVTCRGDFRVQQSVGEVYQVLISCVNEQGVNDTVIDNDSEWLRMTAHLQMNGGEVVRMGNWRWLRMENGALVEVTHTPGVTEIGGEKNEELTVKEAGVDGVEEYFARVQLDGVTYTAGLVLYDTHDPYYISLGRSQNSNVVRESDTVEYQPSVVRRSDNAAQGGWSYQMTKMTMDGRQVGSAATGTRFSVSGSEVKENGGLTIRISATKQ